MEILIEIDIQYDEQKRIGYYVCDFVIGKTIIEVQGDYWHGNPRIYESNKLNFTQRKNIQRDKAKFTYLTNKGYNVICIWEYDIHNNMKKISLNH